MKKSLVALAVLGTLAGTASAQSSVTLFGVVDAGLRFTKGGNQSMDQLAADGQSSSRFGVRGVEDLGGGLKADFFLDSSLGPDTGTVDAAKFWSRRATVGLSGDFGEIRLGRDKTSVRNLIDDADTFGTVGLGDVTTVSASTLGSSAKNNNRSDNEFRYFLPKNLGGIYGSVDMGYGENVDGQKYYGGRIGYKEGPLNLSVGMQVTETFAGPKWGMGAVSGSYDFGMVKLTVFGIETKYAGRKQDAYGINAQIPMGNGMIKVQFTNSNANAAAETAKVAYDANMIAASYIYTLSKRTSLYGTVAQVSNKGLGTVGVKTGAKAYAGGNAGGFNVGMTHAF